MTFPKTKPTNIPRVQFPCDDFVPRKATAPPAPSSDVAQNATPNPYLNTKLVHPKIVAARAKSTNARDGAAICGKAAGWSDLKIDWAQDSSTYPANFPHFVRGRDSVRNYMCDLLQSQIAMYDGAMGTMIQNYGKKNKLGETEYRGERFADWTTSVKGNNDMLSLTMPQVIKNIYLEYLEVGGSNMIGTNTFSATTIAMADYKMEEYAYELNYAGARLAREACDEVTAKDPTKPRFVFGALGPTNRTGSISPSVEDASMRNVTFDELVETYFEQVSHTHTPTTPQLHPQLHPQLPPQLHPTNPTQFRPAAWSTAAAIFSSSRQSSTR